jgi:hypothetical protein
LADVVGKPHTIARKFVKVWCANNFVSGTRETVAAKLIERNQ